MHHLSEEFAHPKINVLHLPQNFSQLEARKTDDDNAKQQKQKIEDSSNCSQPLACAQISHTVFKQAEERPAVSARHRETIAVPDQTNAIFSLHNCAAGRGPYISYGRNLQTCLNRPEAVLKSTCTGFMSKSTPHTRAWLWYQGSSQEFLKEYTEKRCGGPGAVAPEHFSSLR